MPDWFGYADFDAVAVQLDEQGRVLIPDALYDGLTLQFDPVFRQMIGKTGRGQSVHFMRMLPDPIVRNVIEEVLIPAGDVTLAATLSLPEGTGPHPAMVMISGRGCWGRGRSFGRVLTRYGMAVLEYDKRGTGQSSGDCDRATFDQLVADAGAALQWLRDDPRIDARRVGLQGGSAGAWTAQGVAALALDDPDFDVPAYIVTYIGPSTSIETQQRESGDALADQLGLDESAKAAIQRSVDVTLDFTLSNETVFAELDAIREKASEEGWLSQMFGDTDLPVSPEAVDQLWLRRFQFDPASTFSRLGSMPYLSLLGEDDSIVPLPYNADALREAMPDNPNLKIVIIPGTGHGVEHGDRDPVLPDGTTYRKFDTVEPLYFTELIDFLRVHGQLPR
ncbi:MAG: CocE/NonD family hydrolase [Pseudomonadota bacterium]